MKNFLFIALFAFAFFSCKKDEPQPYNVSYKVTETTTATPAYTVSYSTENATQTEGPITAANWSSPTVKKLPGEIATLTLDGGSGAGSFIMQIFSNGVLLTEATMDNPYSPKTISVTLQ